MNELIHLFVAIRWLVTVPFISRRRALFCSLFTFHLLWYRLGTNNPSGGSYYQDFLSKQTMAPLQTSKILWFSYDTQPWSYLFSYFFTIHISKGAGVTSKLELLWVILISDFVGGEGSDLLTFSKKIFSLGWCYRREIRKPCPRINFYIIRRPSFVFLARL